MARWVWAMGLVGTAALGGVRSAAGQHPLDPLTEREIRVATGTMKADPRLQGAAFSLITLAEPDKAQVLTWRPGKSLGDD